MITFASWLTGSHSLNSLICVCFLSVMQHKSQAPLFVVLLSIVVQLKAKTRPTFPSLGHEDVLSWPYWGFYHIYYITSPLFAGQLHIKVGSDVKALTFMLGYLINWYSTCTVQYVLHIVNSSYLWCCRLFFLCSTEVAGEDWAASLCVCVHESVTWWISQRTPPPLPLRDFLSITVPGGIRSGVFNSCDIFKPAFTENTWILMLKQWTINQTESQG